VNRVCTVVGMGPGVSHAVARRFAREGYSIAMIARRIEKLDEYTAEFHTSGWEACGFAADAGEEVPLREAFSAIEETMGATEVLVYNAYRIKPAPLVKMVASEFLGDFRVNVGGALIAVQEVFAGMQASGRGTILLTGGGLALDDGVKTATGGVASLAIGKAGLRSLMVSLANELEPEGIHVATVTICGTVQENTHFAPEKIAECFYTLHAQDTGNWQREIIYK
jgi:short-subunit dehydrogenase